MSVLETLRSMLPDLANQVKQGKVNPAEYLIAAALLLIADDLDAMRKAMQASMPEKKVSK
jgi:hypothetical protein